MGRRLNDDVVGARFDGRTLRVWDPLVRTLHWSLAIAVGLGWATTERIVDWHQPVGYAALAIVGVRIVWGLVGPRHARFASFVRGPGAFLRYAGDMVLYPGTSVHRVEPVTRGARIASFFWVESMVRSDEQRRLLFDMDAHLMRLRSTVGETDPAVIGLTGTYHNLLRLWADA